MKILIADDDSGNSRILHSLLSEYGECNCVVNGQAAVFAFKKALSSGTPYALVMMDIMMPMLDGNEAVKEIRRAEKEMDVKKVNEVPIVMVTSLAEQKDVMKAMGSGASWYMIKPISKDNLLDVMKKYKLVR